MSGVGLNCNGCSTFSEEAPPKWFIVMNSKGKTPAQLEVEGDVAGRQCEKNPDGTEICFQIGMSIATYPAESIDQLVIDPLNGFRQKK